MKAMLEPRKRQAGHRSFTIYERVEVAFPFAWHYHPEVELTWIATGAGTRFVGDSIESYSPGDLVLIGRDLPHTWSSEIRTRSAQHHRAVVVQFPADLFGSGATRYPEFLAIADLLGRATRGVVFPGAITGPIRQDLETMLTERGLDSWCRLARVLDRLARHQDARPLASAGYVPSLQHGAQRRFARALGFIEENIDESSLNLGQVAQAVHLTPTAFSRFFRRMAGRGFVTHVNELRLGRACRALVDTDGSVAEIAFACGFGNLANFNRRFRALKETTPSEFRARFECRGRPLAPTET